MTPRRNSEQRALYPVPGADSYQRASQESDESVRATEQRRPDHVLVRWRRGDYTIVPRPEGHPYLDTWDIIVIVALGATAILLPFEVAMLAEVPLSLYRFDKAIDLVFTTDIVLTFFVAILPTEADDNANFAEGTTNQYVVAPLRIAQQYMAVPFSSNFTAGWFWPDVLTVFPWECVPMAATMSSIRMVRVLRLIRMLRLVRVIKLFNRWKSKVGVPNALVRVVTCAISILIVVHWLACVWGHLGLFPAEDAATTWLSNHLTDGHVIEDMPVMKVYHIALYFCTVVLTTVGFGDAVPHNDVEVLVMILTIFLTALTWAWVVATVVNVLEGIDVFGTHFQQIMDDMNRLMGCKEISPPLKFKVRRHIQRAYTVQRERYHHACIEWLSEGLQGELAIESGLDLIFNEFWYLRDVDLKIKIELADEFKADLFSPHEYIMESDKALVIVQGICERKCKVVGRWGVLGEDVILVSEHLRDTSCPWTLSFLDVMSIHRDSLKTAAVKFPEFDRRLRRGQIKLALWRSFVLEAEKKKAKAARDAKKVRFGTQPRAAKPRPPGSRARMSSWAQSFGMKDNPMEDLGSVMQQMQRAVQTHKEATAQEMGAIRDILSDAHQAVLGVDDRIGAVERTVEALSEVVRVAGGNVSLPQSSSSLPPSPSSNLLQSPSRRLKQKMLALYNTVPVHGPVVRDSPQTRSVSDGLDSPG